MNSDQTLSCPRHVLSIFHAVAAGPGDESGADDAGVRGNEMQDHRVEIAFELCVAANAARYRI